MKISATTTASQVFVVMLIVLFGGIAVNKAHAQKLKAQEIAEKHLEALGGTETLQSVTTRIANGSVVATFKTPTTAQLGGRALLASDGAKNGLAMVFDNTNYPHEKVGYDGKDVSTSYARPGIRSTLGDFLLTHKGIIKQGIWAGALSQGWPLLDLSKNKIKIEAAGTKKIDDRLVHQLRLYPAGSDLTVTLFFDAQTFQHVRTEYSRTIVGQMGSTPETSASQSETRYKLVESFSDFKKEGGLTMPHNYKIYLEILGRNGSFKGEWALTFSEFQFNQRIDPASFDVDDKK